MTGSVALDVVIGLVFIYLLYSLLVTIIGEMISTWLGIRARNLRLAIERMLNDGDQKGAPIATIFSNSLGEYFLYESSDFPKTMAGRFYDQPSIKYLSKSSKEFAFSFHHGKPSYITSLKFSETIIHLFRNKGKGKNDIEKIRYALKYNTLHMQPETLSYFETLLTDADSDLDSLKIKLESWFNETMDEAIGWYKRKIQFLLFWIGFVVVAFFNVDTIEIVSKLSKDTTAREQLVQLGIAAGDSTSTFSRVLNRSKDGSVSSDSIVTKSYVEVRKAVDEAGLVLGLGWENVTPKCIKVFGGYFLIYDQFNPFEKEFWGLVLTALALSLGAPFWFDLLKKLIALRGTGIKPEEKEADKKTQPATSTPKEPVTDAQKPQKPMGPLQTEVQKIKNFIGRHPGVISVEKGFIKDHGVKKEAIEIHVIDEKVKASLILMLNVGAFPVQYWINSEPETHDQKPGDKIYNTLEINGAGTLGCFVSRQGTAKKYLLTCWHVLKGNTDWYNQTGPKAIFRDAEKKGEKIATVVDGTLSDDFDAGFAELESAKTISNSDAGIKINFRTVTVDDALHETGVKFKSTAAVIYNQKVKKELLYSDGLKRELKDLFSITLYDQNGYPTSPSHGGDSGSVVVDGKGAPLGIVVGGDSSFTYVAKLSNVIGANAIYSEYSIITS